MSRVVYLIASEAVKRTDQGTLQYSNGSQRSLTLELAAEASRVGTRLFDDEKLGR